MTTINISNARAQLFKLADSCIKYNDVVNINTKDGNVVMMSEDEYGGLLETLYLCGKKGGRESRLAERAVPTSELGEMTWDGWVSDSFDETSKEVS